MRQSREDNLRKLLDSPGAPREIDNEGSIADAGYGWTEHSWGYFKVSALIASAHPGRGLSIMAKAASGMTSRSSGTMSY
jgi:hypothetical protein